MVRTHGLVGIQPIAPGPCVGGLCLYLSFSPRCSPTAPPPPPHCPCPSHLLALQTSAPNSHSQGSLRKPSDPPGCRVNLWNKQLSLALCVCVCVCVCVMTCDHRSESVHSSLYSPPSNAWHMGEAPYRSTKRNYKDIITASVYQALTMC